MNIRLYFNTIRHLKPLQIIDRIWFRMYRPRPDMRPAPERREIFRSWYSDVQRRPSMEESRRFIFLNEQHELNDSDSWNHPAWSKLWLYNLHYFDDLNSVGADKRQEWHRSNIARWIRENSPGQGVGWNSYPVSLRIVNWIKWSLTGYVLSTEAVLSLAVQIRWLARRIEHHLLGNHLMVNAKALVFAGLYFDGEEAGGWLKNGEQILAREVKEQILGDGGHFERTPMYHLLILEDLLDLFNLYRLFDRQPPSVWLDAINRMLSWSVVMRHPDGQIPFFNDAAEGIAPLPEQLDIYADKLGFRLPMAKKGGFLEQSGFVRLESENVTLFADIGSVGPEYLPAHAHAGTLSFELSIGKKRCFVNSGVSTYEPGGERERQRSTRVHNTVQVDGKNSSEVWASFRVARRARVFDRVVDVTPLESFAKASHDGYARLKSPVVHQRQWRLGREILEVKDRLIGSKQHHVEVTFILHPEVKVVGDGRKFRLFADSGFYVLFEPDPTLLIELEEGSYHPEFGLTLNTQVIRCTRNTVLPQDFVHRIQCLKSEK